MNRAVAFLKALGSTLARPTFMKYFNTERALNRSAPEYPKSLKPDNASGPAVYRLSYSNYQQTWETFKKVHNRQYATEEEERKRYNIFMETVKLIEKNNWQYYNGDSSFHMGITQFTDTSQEEYRMIANKLRSFKDKRCVCRPKCSHYSC